MRLLPATPPTSTTLRGLLERIRARTILHCAVGWLMEPRRADRGGCSPICAPPKPPVHYLVARRWGRLTRLEKHLEATVALGRPGCRSAIAREAELYVLSQNDATVGRQRAGDAGGVEAVWARP